MQTQNARCSTLARVPSLSRVSLPPTDTDTQHTTHSERRSVVNIQYRSSCWYKLASLGSPSQLREPCRGALTQPRAPGLSWALLGGRAGWRAFGRPDGGTRQFSTRATPLRGHQTGLTSHLAACNGWASRGPLTHTRSESPAQSCTRRAPLQTGWRAGGRARQLGLVWSARWSAGGRRASNQAAPGLGVEPIRVQVLVSRFRFRFRSRAQGPGRLRLGWLGCLFNLSQGCPLHYC